MIYVAKTRTGAIYIIDKDKNEWSKYRPHGEFVYKEDGPHELTSLMVGTELSHPYSDKAFYTDNDTWWNAERPEVGKHMYIQGRGMHTWWISTEMVSVDVIESFDPETYFEG